MNIKKFYLLLLFLSAAVSLNAQKVGIKTNLFYDALATVNAGIEVGLAPRWTLDISGNYKGWTIKGRKTKHWLVQPEARYWFCDRFSGHFLGIHALGGQYNMGHFKSKLHFLGTDFRGLENYRYQGWGVGGGIAYGYSWILGKHWNMEAEIGIGYIYTRYDVFECADCGKRVDNRHHHYVGPTKGALNLIYLF